jgi:hypothetical protein
LVAPTKPKSGGLELDSVPRPYLIKEENTIEGVKYSSKPMLGNPPPVPWCTTRHTAIDEGNSIPRLFRCSLQTLLADGTSFLNTTQFPFGAVVQPFAELGAHETPIPFSKNGGETLIRCRICGAYINSRFTFIGGDSSVKCNICEGVTPLPSTPFNASSGSNRPETIFGTCEFAAPKALEGIKIGGNNVILLIDCGVNAVNSGNIFEDSYFS